MKSRNWIFAKRNKFNSQTQTVDGISFHSKKEAAYYQELKLRKKCRDIMDFERQVSFELYGWYPNKDTSQNERKKVCCHIVDFLVTTKEGNKEVHEVKGFATDVWELKHKLFEANYPDVPYRVVR